MKCAPVSSVWILIHLLFCLCVSSFKFGSKLIRNNRAFIHKAHGSKVGTGVETEVTPEPDSLLTALTREEGHNFPLAAELKDIRTCEIPCIEFTTLGPFPNLLSEIQKHECVLISSPHAADIFGDASVVGKLSNVKVISLGKGTSKRLKDFGIDPVFEPSVPSMECLLEEFPASLGKTILYLCSKLAQNIEPVLAERGIQVTRLDTYTTIAAEWTAEKLEQAKTVKVVALASPSAALSWATIVGTEAKAVVIGSTTEKAARALGFEKVYCPVESAGGGLKPFADLIRDVALQKVD